MRLLALAAAPALVVALIASGAGVSGASMNPAMALALAAAGGGAFPRLGVYVAAPLVGALAGGGLVRAVASRARRGGAGAAGGAPPAAAAAVKTGKNE